MGTSKSYGGPVGINPLLPPWAQGPEEPVPAGDPGGVIEPNVNGPEAAVNAPAQVPEAWTDPRRTAVSLASARGSRGIPRAPVRRIARGYVRALGGARRAAASAIAGRATAQSFGNFLSFVTSAGVSATIERFGLARFLGRDVRTLLAGLADALAPSGALTEDAIARVALTEALAELFDRYAVAENGLAALDRLDADGIREALQSYIAHYINERLMQALASRIENGASSPDRAVAIEREIREYITLTVQLDLSRTDVVGLDWRGQQAQVLVSRILEEGYRLVEAAP